MPGKTAVVGVAELRGLDVLGWLPAIRLDALSRRMTALRVKRGEVLYRPGQSARHIYCVLDGAVGLSLVSSEGRAVQLALLTRGEFFGETALVRGWRRVSEATALEDSRVGRIEARTLVTDVCGLSWDLVTGLTETDTQAAVPGFLATLALPGRRATRPGGARPVGVCGASGSQTRAGIAPGDPHARAARRRGRGLPAARITRTENAGAPRALSSRRKADPRSGAALAQVPGTEIRVSSVILASSRSSYSA